MLGTDLYQELSKDYELSALVENPDGMLDPFSRMDRNGGFFYYKTVRGHRQGYLAGYVLDMGKVRLPVILGGRPHGNEYHPALLHAFLYAGPEGKPALFRVAFDELFESGFIYGDLAGF